MTHSTDTSTLFRLVIAVFVSLISCHNPEEVRLDSKRSFVWTVDTLVYTGPPPSPNRVGVRCIWGSSAHDVWAVASSDDVLGELWHYDGTLWRVVTDWPYNGIDAGGGYLNDVTAVSGFDSSNVFLFGFHGYDTTGTDVVLKWNGLSWSSIPWQGGFPPRGGLGWGVKQNRNNLWAVSSIGQVVKYDGGVLSVDTVIVGYRFTSQVIAGLDNGLVYLNAYKDSLRGDSTYLGGITKLYRRDLLGSWSLLEEKFIEGANYDGNGLGRGLSSVGNRLFTGNRGFWERTSDGWVLVLSLSYVGGQCLTSETELWVYFNQVLWHLENGEWSEVRLDLLSKYPNFYLYGSGWSDGADIFIPFQNGIRSHILHGKMKGG
jgi:hypothetical protein